MTIKMELEKMFLLQIMDENISIPLHEYRFHTTRRWRFDYAWINQKVAVEIEGGVWLQGRHNRPTGFIRDCEKYNAAQEMGWRVFRYTRETLEDWSAIKQIKRVLDQ